MLPRSGAFGSDLIGAEYYQTSGKSGFLNYRSLLKSIILRVTLLTAANWHHSPNMHIKRYQSWILAGISGILLILSFPSFNLFPLAWISLIPLLIVLQSTPSWKSAFLHGYLTGVIFFLGLVYWITLLYPFANIFLTTFACLLLAAYLAVYFGIFSALLHGLPWKSGLPFIFIATAIWIGLEWVRSWFLNRFSVGQHGLYTME